VAQLGANAFGEVLVPGRVPDCYLGLRLDPDDDAQATGVLIIGPAIVLHPSVPQPDGTVLYELLTGHPDRMPRELVFLADLTVELRAWPADTWPKVGIDPQAAAGAVVAGWRRGDLLGLRLGGLTAEEALALERPAMTYVRAQLGDRLGRQLARAYRRWRHPSSGRRPGDRFCSRGHPQPAAGSAVDTGRPDPGRGLPDAAVDSGRLLRPVRQPTGHPLGDHHPAVRTASPGGRSSASTSDTLAVSAGDGRCPLPQSAGVPGCSATGGRRVPALLRAAAVSMVDSSRPASTRPHPAALPAAPRTLPRCAVPRTPAGGFRARSAQPAEIDGPDARTVDAARRLGQWTRLVDTGSL
jgi:hypothetical protein